MIMKTKYKQDVVYHEEGKKAHHVLQKDDNDLLIYEIIHVLE